MEVVVVVVESRHVSRLTCWGLGYVVEGVCVAVAVVGATVAEKLREMEGTRKDNNREAAVVRPRP